ncbi:MAG: phage antirepressor KilAC domain-containing protein [Shewanella sp.]
MNQLITATQLTMSTREIAQLLGKHHSNVKISAERLAEKGIIALQDTPYVHEQNGQTYSEYHLSKRDSLILVAQNCPEFTAAIVDRWQELESQQAPKLPKSFSQALQLAADQAKVIEDQQAAIALAAPKVEFVDRYVESKGNKGFRQVAKLLKAKENEFRAYLSVNKILYRLGGEWAPYQCHIDAGRFEVSTGTANDHAYNAARFTPKGVEWIAGLWAVHQLKKEAK